MKIDWYAKMILTAAGAAPWMIALNPWIPPTDLRAQTVEEPRPFDRPGETPRLHERPGDMGMDLLNIRVWNIQADLRDVVQGQCPSRKIC